jgi:nicotinate-nucleotide adenylyltransferase
MHHWFPPNSVSFYFITGLDAVLDIMSWKEPFEIAKTCNIVAVSRPGYNKSKLQELPEEIKSSIIPLEIPLLAISSTEIRTRVSEGKSTIFIRTPFTIETDGDQ